jgi:hypothetical protein
LGRRVGGAAFVWIIDRLGFDVTSDPHCGVKVLRTTPLHGVLDACRSPRFAFDTEMIARARDAGLRVVECPVEWRHVEGSTIRPLRDGASTIRDLVALRRQLHIERGTSRAGITSRVTSRPASADQPSGVTSGVVACTTTSMVADASFPPSS